MFVHRSPQNLKGSVAELAIAKEAARCGVGVLFPVTEHGRYDMAFEIGDHLLRVQCKSANKAGDVVRINLSSCRHSPGRGYLHRTYTAKEIDAVAAYCAELDCCYLMAIEQAAARRAIHLRLAPARNNQRAAINFASDYEFAGAVAQLEEHLDGIEGVVGSSPSSSIEDRFSRTTTVGSEEFGYRYARFLERAAAGESFLITRRGRPMARISPPDPSCAPATEPV